MSNDDQIEKYAREVHDLRVVLVLIMHMWAEQAGTRTEFEELSADWDDLASSLRESQWLVGVRAFDHVDALRFAEEVIPDSKSLLQRLFRGYSAMGCTRYSPPRMMEPRFLVNGIAHIKTEFERSATARTRKQNAQCDKQGEWALSRHDTAVESNDGKVC